MNIKYLNKIVKQNIDINELRPNKSYDHLILNRNGHLSNLIQDKEALRKFLHSRTCPCCNSNSYKFKFEKDNLNVVECNDCQIIYVNPIFDLQKYQDTYESIDYQSIVKKLGEQSHIYRKNRFGKERYEFITQYHNDGLPKRVLDIGCSTGFLLDYFNEQKSGWLAEGIELNPSAYQFGIDRGLQIHNVSIENFKVNEKYSAITLFDVLEHLADPIQVLGKIKDMLHDGGNIFIYVPNYNSATKEILGIENSHFIWPTHHLTYFTPDSLRMFLEKAGFEVFFWETQGLDLQDILWYLNEKTEINTDFLEKNIDVLQFYINSSGHGKNLRMFAKYNNKI